MEEVVVSIFCIAYNQEKYIGKTLESLVNQKTNFKYEILVHDDASTDKTAEIIREYEMRFPLLVKAVYQTENQYSKGIRANAHINYPRAKGKYIAFCEGDDYWTDSMKLQKQVDALGKNTGCVLCTHVTKNIDKDGKDGKGQFPRIPLHAGVISREEYLTHELVDCPWLFHLSSFLLEKETYGEFLRVRREELRSFPAGDKALVLFLLTKGDCIYLNDEMSCYRVDSGGVMSKVKTDLKFAIRFHERFSQGYQEYARYVNGDYHEMITKRIMSSKIEALKLYGDYKTILSREYRVGFTNLRFRTKLLIWIGRAFPKLTNKLYLKLKGYS